MSDDCAALRDADVKGDLQRLLLGEVKRVLYHALREVHQDVCVFARVECEAGYRPEGLWRQR